MSLEWILSPEAFAGLLTLTALEIVLGIDNVIFLSILVSRMPMERQAMTRRLGLMFAAVTRIGLLSVTAWMSRMTEPLLTLGQYNLSVRDLVLGGGGAFLIAKGTTEIHEMIEGGDEATEGRAIASNMAIVVAQIAILDIVFSLDSVITAVGMVDHIAIMYAAIVSSTAVMLLAAAAVSAFISRHPTAKMLALAFLLLVGVALIADALHFHIPRGYLYSAIAFSAGVEALNLLGRRRKQVPLTIHTPFMPDTTTVNMLVESLSDGQHTQDGDPVERIKVPLSTWR